MSSLNSNQSDVGDFVEAFEEARASGERTSVVQFAPPPEHPRYREIVVELIRVDLEHQWQLGERVSTADYQEKFPEIAGDTECLYGIAYEEYRLRRLAGEAVPRREFRDRYGVSVDDWRELPVGDVSASGTPSLTESVDEIGAEASAEAVAEFPSVGDTFVGFELVGELGRGAFGHVYLARQGQLAKRFVALKVTTQQTHEPQRLAQLQHTNIVPIYSVHQESGLTAICMPFFGPNTLADVLHSFAGSDVVPASGQAIVSTMAARQASTVVRQCSSLSTGRRTQLASLLEAEHHQGESIKRLGTMSYHDAAVWIAARVAAGLAHAHEHGVIHRDLKPANILLSDDGEPLILDFNLAVDATTQRRASAIIGGTLPYMAPEHIHALRSGGAIKPQSDVYSLGVILYEILTSRRPYPERKGTFDRVTAAMQRDRQDPPTRVRDFNSSVSVDLETIVLKCLAPNPLDRFQSARELHEDLQRHLENRPLKHTPNLSIAETGRKWIRRHPKVSSSSSIALALALVIATLVGLLRVRGIELARTRAATASSELHHGVVRARTSLASPFVDEAELSAAISAAERLAQDHGFLTADEDAAWRHFSSLGPTARDAYRREAAELLYLLASSKYRQAMRTGIESMVLKTALELNDRSRSIAPDYLAKGLLLQRARLLRSAGRDTEASEFLAVAAEHKSDDFRSRRVLAAEARATFDLERAAKLYKGLTQVTPQDPSLWFSLGSCYLSLQRFADAENCFHAALVLQPDFTLARDHLGISRLYQSKFAEAREDFTSVLERKPNLTAALVNRALANKGLGKIPQAIEDLEAAVERGAQQTRVHFILARLKAAAGDAQAAAESRKRGLNLAPRDEQSWVARGVARLPDEPQDALQDFRAALRFNPRSQPAWQNIAHVLAERLGRPEEALLALDTLVELNGSDVSALAARGVLRARLGRRSQAIEDAQQILQSTLTPIQRYQVGCIYALTSTDHPQDAQSAVQHIAQALAADASLATVAARDPDIRPLQADPQLRRVLTAAATINRLSKGPVGP